MFTNSSSTTSSTNTQKSSVTITSISSIHAQDSSETVNPTSHKKQKLIEKLKKEPSITIQVPPTSASSLSFTNIITKDPISELNTLNPEQIDIFDTHYQEIMSYYKIPHANLSKIIDLFYIEQQKLIKKLLGIGSNDHPTPNTLSSSVNTPDDNKIAKLAKILTAGQVEEIAKLLARCDLYKNKAYLTQTEQEAVNKSFAEYIKNYLFMLDEEDIKFLRDIKPILPFLVSNNQYGSLDALLKLDPHSKRLLADPKALNGINQIDLHSKVTLKISDLLTSSLLKTKAEVIFFLSYFNNIVSLCSNQEISKYTPVKQNITLNDILALKPTVRWVVVLSANPFGNLMMNRGLPFFTDFANRPWQEDEDDTLFDYNTWFSNPDITKKVVTKSNPNTASRLYHILQKVSEWTTFGELFKFDTLMSAGADEFNDLIVTLDLVWEKLFADKKQDSQNSGPEDHHSENDNSKPNMIISTLIMQYRRYKESGDVPDPKKLGSMSRSLLRHIRKKKIDTNDFGIESVGDEEANAKFIDTDSIINKASGDKPNPKRSIASTQADNMSNNDHNTTCNTSNETPTRLIKRPKTEISTFSEQTTYNHDDHRSNDSSSSISSRSKADLSSTNHPKGSSSVTTINLSNNSSSSSSEIMSNLSCNATRVSTSSSASSIVSTKQTSNLPYQVKMTNATSVSSSSSSSSSSSNSSTSSANHPKGSSSVTTISLSNNSSSSTSEIMSNLSSNATRANTSSAFRQHWPSIKSNNTSSSISSIISTATATPTAQILQLSRPVTNNPAVASTMQVDQAPQTGRDSDVEMQPGKNTPRNTI
ncbi:MAG: hypothetical protein KIT27_08710 [Legionellales bacterium]|nr:hypothetical protein [Legionellales bacterium]